MTDRYLRVAQIVNNRKTGARGIIPISNSSWWAGIRAGKYPQPIKLGSRTTVWRESEILAFIARGGL